MLGLSSLFHKYSLVKQIPIFNKLNLFDLQRIAQKANLIEYKKGDIICQQGKPADGFYCLISGRVQAYSLNIDGRKSDVEFIHRGMHFGIISLLTGEHHSLSYEALNDSIVLKIDKDDFQHILSAVPQLGVEMSHSLSKRIRSKRAKSKFIFESSIISIYSPVKGSGSSTYAANLALSLERETRKKVILVNISTAAEIKEAEASKVGEASPTFGEASPKWKKAPVELGSIIDDHEKIIHSIGRGEMAVDLLRVSFDPADVSLVNRMGQFVSSLVHDYHYVVVDLPNEMDDVVLKTLTQSDLIQLVTLDRTEDLKLTHQVICSLEEQLKEKFEQETLQVIISGKQEACYLSFEEVNRQIDFEVYRKLPRIESSQLNVAVVGKTMSITVPSPESDYAQEVRKIARHISGILVGLVLGGGAALGVAHIGVIRVLEEEHIPIDVVVGTSMGALVGAYWTTGKNSYDLEKLAREFTSARSLWKLVDPVFPKSGLVGGRMIKHWLSSRGLKDKTFYSTRIPLKIVTYDLIKRQEIVIGSGSLVDAVRKSAAIPGVINPVIEGDRVIIDGGVLNPLPTNVLLQMGVKKIIAINVLQSPEHVTKGYETEQEAIRAAMKVPFRQAPWHYVSWRAGMFVKKLMTPNIADIIVRGLQASEYIISQANAQYADVLIHPNLENINWYELYKVDELIKRGEEATRQALPEIKKLIAE